MTYRETCILLPCHSLEDFPMHYEGEDADGLLSAWTALWHPTLLAATGSAPNWYRGDSPPSDLEGRLIVAPGVSTNEIPTGFPERAAKEGARVVLGNFPRAEILRRALEPLAEEAASLDPDLVADFLALGYCYLQVELLTRQMRYSTNLDEIHFYSQVVAGAVAAVEGNIEEARAQLVACFDLLSQERDHYYAVDAYIVDIVLLSSSNLGTPLQSQLAPGIPVNLLLTAQLLSAIAQQEPASLEALRKGITEGCVGLIGGETVETRAPLQSCETVLNCLRAGLSQFEEHLGRRPQTYGRRRFGLSVLHPQLLQRLGYVGALHAALGEGQCPEGSQLKIRWEGSDNSTIDAIGRVPLHADRPETFLALASKLGETMDMDHVATLCLAHWPGHVSPWYDDLRRTARYGSMLGKFVTVDEYFQDTDYPGQSEHFQADQYRSPYLRQAITRQQTDPVSTSVRYWRRRCLGCELQAFETLVNLVGDRQLTDAHSLIDDIDAHADEAEQQDLDTRIADAMEHATQQAAGLIPHQEGPARPGYLLLNPSSFVRRATVDMPLLESLPQISKPVYAAAQDGDHRRVVVDVPPMGFAWVTGGPPQKSSRRPPQLLAEPFRLFNEFLEAHINPTTGSLQAIYDYQKRGNRLSQQLAVRFPRAARERGGEAAAYSVMVADRVDVTVASTALGEICTEGRLVDRRGTALAKYRQTYQLWRGSRVLRLQIELDPLDELGGDPWNSYFACRFAWASEAALLWRGVNQLRERAEAKQIEAPCYIEIDESPRNAVILTGGIPFHRRSDSRMLDSLLVVHGERARKFELGIGINLKYPLQESLAFMTSIPMVQQAAAPPQGPTSGWMFHIDSRNVVATAWEPLADGPEVAGFRVRLLETAKRPARAKLHCFRSVSSAQRLDFNGGPLGSCPVEDGVVTIEMGAGEWIEVEARW